jgi:hypothetical protein
MELQLVKARDRFEALLKAEKVAIILNNNKVKALHLTLN